MCCVGSGICDGLGTRSEESIVCLCVCVCLSNSVKTQKGSGLGKFCGPGSVVRIALGYGKDGPGIESRWGARFSAPVQTGPGAHPASCTMGTRSFPGVKRGRRVTLTPYPLLVPLVMKEYSYTSTPPMGRTACTEPQCLYKGDLYLPFYLGKF